MTCLFKFGRIHLIYIASFILNWYSVAERSITEKQSFSHTLLHARDSCKCLKMLDLASFCRCSLVLVMKCLVVSPT